MGKKVREYKSGDFIFAKVKGYPAWPARVQRLNGKKYFVYFYGTGETANLPPNMIFDYAENKDKFLTKTQKRRDFNDGVKQIEHDFANNVPLEDVIGAPMEVGADVPADDTVNDTINSSMDETVDTTAADDTADDETITNTTQNDAAVEDSDENNLIIDEGKGTKKKTKPEIAKTPAKETPKPKEPKTPRSKAKKEENKKDDKEDGDDEKKDEEIVSRSGRKIRPKRFVDEQTEENSTLPSPAAKKRRGASPAVEKKAETEKTEKDKPESAEKNIKSYNAVTQSELEELKQPFKPEDAEKENILIAYLPTGKYVGIKLFQSRPNSFKNESTRLQWDKQAASNAITLRMQLERGQITALAVQGQLVMDLNLTDEEKATLDKERETEEKKCRVQFLKNEMKLIELDAKIKTCLSLEKADTDMCLKLLDELLVLEVKPLMLLKHPTCLETVKRMRAYVGNTPSWDLSEKAALLFSKQAHKIRKVADIIYRSMKKLFTTPDGLSFWEFFSERALQFKKIAAKLSASELLEMVHEPIEMSQPTTHTMKAAIDAANSKPEDDAAKKKAAPVKPKKPANNNTATPAKGKRQSTRKRADSEESVKPAEEASKDDVDEQSNAGTVQIVIEIAEEVTKDDAATPKEQATPKSAEEVEKDGEEEAKKDTEEQASDKESVVQENAKSKDKKNKIVKEGKKSSRNAGKAAKEAEKAEAEKKDAENSAKDDNDNKDVEMAETDKDAKEADDKEKDAEKDDAKAEKTEKDDKTEEKAENTNNDKSSKVTENTKDDEAKEAETSPKNETQAKKAKEIEGKTTKCPKKSTKDEDSTKENTTDSEKSTDVKLPEDKSTEAENMDIAESTQDTDAKDKNEPKDKVTKKDAKKNGKDDKKESVKEKDGAKEKEGEKRKAEEDDKAEKTKDDSGEPRAKRSRETRESKKTEAVPRSPAKRKSKY